MKFESGQLINSKYELIECLGEGGQGQVWKAEQMGHAGFRKEVVLKLLLPQENQKQASLIMFSDEARLAAHLHHPNIVEVYDLGKDDSQGFLFIAMEWIRGADLKKVLRQSMKDLGEPIPFRLAAYIVLEICKGLHYAHTQKDKHGHPLQLIHRDLKPPNIILTENGYIKVIDFGIAKSKINEGKTETGLVRGTPAYMAPEQVTKQKVDQRVDLFALGAIFYELCVGRPLHFEGDLYQIIYAIMNKTPEPIRNTIPNFPAELEKIIFKLIEKNPQQRFQSAAALQTALESFLQTSGQQISQNDLIRFYKSLWKPKTTVSRLQDFLHPAQDAIKETPSPPHQTAKLAGGTPLQPKKQLPHPSNRIPYQPEQLQTPRTTAKVEKPVDERTKVPPRTDTTSSPLRKLSTKGLLALFFLIALISALSFFITKRAFINSNPSSALERNQTNDGGTTLPTNTKDEVTQPQIPDAKERSIPEDKLAPETMSQKVNRYKVHLDIRPTCKLYHYAKKRNKFMGISHKTFLLKAGKYSWSCINRKEGFTNYIKFEVSPSQNNRVFKKFRKGILYALTDPAAEILINGKAKGEVESDISLYEGYYFKTILLRYKRKGKVKYYRIKKIRIRAGKTTSYPNVDSKELP